MPPYLVVLTLTRKWLRIAYSAVRKVCKATVPLWVFLGRARHLHKLATEIMGGLLVLVGVAQWSVPSALILGGLAVVAAIEVRA